jgi:ppGpp synthetase/RelA/SpoT-type nucleotidyltranferase
MPTLTEVDATESEPATQLSFGDYEAWLEQRHSIDLLSHKNHYSVVTRQLSDSFRTSPFWIALLHALPNIDSQYLIDHKYPLLTALEPEILVKPWASFLQKTYRKNVIQNPDFPSPPHDGWCLPPQWLARIHDIVRTSIVVKYLDGVPILLQSLKKIADDHSLLCEANLEARVDGYYGGHFNCRKECEIPTMEWSTMKDTFEIEIQVTTQIKDVIKGLLHRYYETSRTTRKTPSNDEMSWNYRNEEFIATYLGHILHYVDGMIIEVRNRNRDERGTVNA